MKTITIAQRNNLKTNKKNIKIIKQLSIYSAKLYNYGLKNALYYFFENNEYLDYNKNYHLCKNNENYKLLLSDTSQQILRIVDRDFKSYYNFLKLKTAGKYSDKIEIPRQKKEKELMNITIQGRSARIRNGFVIIGLSKAFKEKHSIETKELKFKLPKNIQAEKLQEVRIIPVCNGMEFDIEFVYHKVTKQISLDKNRFLTITSSLNNLATCFNSENGESFIIDGKYIKSVNYYFNRQKKYHQKKKNKQYSCNKKLLKLLRKRNNKINNYFNLSVKYITEYAVKHKVGSVIIENSFFSRKKKNTNKITFVNISYGFFKRKLKSKCEQLGINIDFTDEDSIKNPLQFKEKTKINQNIFKNRKGLYRTPEGYLINANVNRTIELFIKYLIENNIKFPEVITKRKISMLYPKRIKLNKKDVW